MRRAGFAFLFLSSTLTLIIRLILRHLFYNCDCRSPKLTGDYRYNKTLPSASQGAGFGTRRILRIFIKNLSV